MRLTHVRIRDAYIHVKNKLGVKYLALLTYFFLSLIFQITLMIERINS